MGGNSFTKINFMGGWVVLQQCIIVLSMTVLNSLQGVGECIMDFAMMPNYHMYVGKKVC